jgi:hypothetical protein
MTMHAEYGVRACPAVLLAASALMPFSTPPARRLPNGACLLAR